MKLYFVRHGQSEANLRKEYYNDFWAPLTTLGQVQAATAGEKLKESGEEFSAIFAHLM